MQREAAVLHSVWHLRTALSGVCVLAGGMAGEPLAFVHGGVHARLPAAVRRLMSARGTLRRVRFMLPEQCCTASGVRSRSLFCPSSCSTRSVWDAVCSC